MDIKNIAMVQESFSKVMTLGEKAVGELFYQNLFEMNPELRPLFKSGISTQGIMLVTSLTLIVRNLEYPERIISFVHGLADRHVGYSVKEEHYKVVGECLIKTLSQGLGQSFTKELEAAWIEAYAMLSSIMVEHAYKK